MARVYDILDMDHELNGRFFEREDYDPHESPINLFNTLIIGLIFLNVVAFILGTYEPVETKYGDFLTVFEIVSVAIFTMEYALRVWTCTLHPGYAGARGRLKYMTSFFAIIDLLSFLPFYMQFSVITAPLLFPDGRFFRSLRLIRVIKIFKYSSSMITLKNVILAKKDDLILTLVIGVFLLFISASFMFYFEHDAPGQPAFNNLFDSLYWGIVPLTAVGYGDIAPVTTGGRLVSMVITLICITMMALPTGIISEGFIEEKKRMKDENSHKCDAAPAGNGAGQTAPDTGSFAADGLSGEEGDAVMRCPHCNKPINVSINKKP